MHLAPEIRQPVRLTPEEAQDYRRRIKHYPVILTGQAPDYVLTFRGRTLADSLYLKRLLFP